MAFKRAAWHSGLTYEQTCPQCKTVVKYKDTILDFRPWYADGFVYCPTCKKPLRHKEIYAIDAILQEQKVVDLTENKQTNYCKLTLPELKRYSFIQNCSKFCEVFLSIVGSSVRFCSVHFSSFQFSRSVVSSSL